MNRSNLPASRDSLYELFRAVDCASFLDKLLSAGASVYLTAGAVRDTLSRIEAGSSVPRPRDLDFCVADLPRSAFDRLCTECSGTRNRFNGYRLRTAAGVSLDVWRQEESIGLRRTGAPSSLANVLRSFVVDCNAVAFDVDTGFFYDHGGLRAIEDRTMGFAQSAILNSHDVIAAKALVLSFRNGLALGPEFADYIVRNISDARLRREAYKAATVTPGVLRATEAWRHEWRRSICQSISAASSNSTNRFGLPPLITPRANSPSLPGRKKESHQQHSR